MENDRVQSVVRNAHYIQRWFEADNIGEGGEGCTTFLPNEV